MKIKPCPCCGNSNIISHVFGYEGTVNVGIAIECEQCGCGMSSDVYKTKEQIIKAWNKRV